MHLAFLALHLLVQASPAQRPPATAVHDSTPKDSIRRNSPRRLPVTQQVLATAFHDQAARELFNRARALRMAHDSAIMSYEATARQRVSVGVGVGKLGRDRLAFRQESASRVRWQRGVGARVEMTGARVAIPVIGSQKLEREALQDLVIGPDMSPIPYFPGSEALWGGQSQLQAEVDERELVNPLALGAEAYYTYRTGDSVTFRLPDGRAIRLRELEIRPRLAKWNLAVGSFWFDAQSGNLVRAAYRLAAPARMQVSVNESDDSTRRSTRAKVAAWMISGMIGPGTAELSAIAIDYGLYEGRFWLPRSQSMEGHFEMMFARVPLRFENSFTYTSVNADLAMVPIPVDTSHYLRDEPPDSLGPEARKAWRDSVQAIRVARAKARADSTKAGMKVGSMAQCDTSSVRASRTYRFDKRLAVEVVAPCDLSKLASSPDLPPSIYDPGEEIFDASQRDELIKQSLPMGAQAAIKLGSLPRPRISIGPSMMRYNRIEGFSAGARFDQQLGGGYATRLIGRFGVEDQIPNVEASISRTNLDKTVTLNGYRRLTSANDWGSPFSLRSSLSALFFGRDEGFYYRATGAEVLWTSRRFARLEWRAFGERQSDARQQTSYSFVGDFSPNITASTVDAIGGSVRFQHSYGQNPEWFRSFTDLRLEGAGGDSTYGRGALEVTLSRQLLARIAGAVTLGAGTSVGGLPLQRYWFLGGTQTVRGQSADTAQSGNAFWMTRAELARTMPFVRASLFGDLGWVGDRSSIGEFGRPMSGAGIGFSAFDGLIRLDVARGIYPRVQTTFALYLDARF
jgi:hypothetical protein